MSLKIVPLRLLPLPPRGQWVSLFSYHWLGPHQQTNPVVLFKMAEQADMVMWNLVILWGLIYCSYAITWKKDKNRETWKNFLIISLSFCLVTVSQWGMSNWSLWLGLLSWFHICISNHCNSFEDWVPIDEIFSTSAQSSNELQKLQNITG